MQRKLKDIKTNFGLFVKCMWPVRAHPTVKAIIYRNAAVLWIWAPDFPGGSGWRLHTGSLMAVCVEVLGDLTVAFWAWGAEAFLDLDVAEEGRQKPRTGAWNEGFEYQVTLGIFLSCSKILIEIICSLPLSFGQFVSRVICLMAHVRSLEEFYV